MNSIQSHQRNFRIGTEVSWEDAGRGPGRTGTALHLSPASWFSSLRTIGGMEVQVLTNCNTRNQFNSNKPIKNCRGDLTTNFSPEQLLASKPATELRHNK